MAVTRTSTGALVSSAAALTATFGVGATAGDLGILIVETANQTVATPSGWTNVDGFGVGTAGAAGGTACWIFAKASITSGDISGGIAVADSGDHQNAVLLTFTGYDATTPYVDTFFGSNSAAETGPNINSATGRSTTVTANDLALGIICTDRDSATVSTNSGATWSNIAGSNSFIVNVSSATGAGGGIIVNQLTPSGTQTADVSFTCTMTSSIWAGVVLVIKAAATGTTVSPSKGALTFGGKTPSLTLALNPATGHISFGGKVSLVTVGISLSPSKGAIVFGGKQPSLSLNIAISPSAGHLTFGGKIPTVTRTTMLSAAAGHLTLTGKLPTAVLGVNVFPIAGHLALSGKIPTVTFTFRVSPSAGHIAFGGKVPTVSISSGLLPSTGHLTFSGKVPVLTTTLNPATGHLAFSGHVSALGFAVGPNTGHIVFAGHLPLFGGPIMPLAGHIAFSGNTPAITYGIGAIGHIKVDLGSFVAKPVKFWDGTAWVTKPLKYWTGTAWRATSY